MLFITHSLIFGLRKKDIINAAIKDIKYDLQKDKVKMEINADNPLFAAVITMLIIKLITAELIAARIIFCFKLILTKHGCNKCKTD